MPVYPQFLNQSLIGLYAERIRIYKHLFPGKWKWDEESEYLYLWREEKVKNIIVESQDPIDALLDPEVLIGHELDEKGSINAEEFKKSFDENLPSPGPIVFRYAEGLGA